MLIILSGRSGAGKTTVAREAARAMGALHVRIDSIEQALRQAGTDVSDHGYRVGYALAEDNLRLGRTVIADSVNPWPLTREAWRAVATRAGVRSIDVEIVCSDSVEHRRRVETRLPDIAVHVLPTWEDVRNRDYRPWDTDRLIIDTSTMGMAEAVQAIRLRT